VEKAGNAAEYEQQVERLLNKSELVVAQEFLPTDFDWRIGVIDRKPLYACKYFMARNHWQIYNKHDDGEDRMGEFEAVPVEIAPQRVVRTAVKAASAVGNGLYGVDLKEARGKCWVIEVNDNPSIDSGVEDKTLRDSLYERIIEVFLKRLEAQRDGRGLP
jgi:glutathione synthase/RimK-type ligase-like ATP-grasp enzyme